MDILVLVGILRWILGLKRDNIDSFLNGKGIHISTGLISELSIDFLLLFKKLHESLYTRINTVFARRKGVILHVDGTQERGSKVVFPLMDGQTEIMIDADVIQSEGATHIKPMFEKFQKHFGAPLVIVRDMSKPIHTAAKEVFPDTPQQICHPHFLRDLEKNLLIPLHKDLKKRIVHHKLTPRLVKLRNGLPEKPEQKYIALEQKWVHIAVDYILFPTTKGVYYVSHPISYLEQFSRIAEVKKMVRKLIMKNADCWIHCEEVMVLDSCLSSILEDTSCTKAYWKLRRTITWLDKIRSILRLGRRDHLKQQRILTTSDIHEIRKALKNGLDKISKEAGELGKEYTHISEKITKSVESHLEELFVPNPIVDNIEILLRRDNNGLEYEHRKCRKLIRVRTGRSSTNNEMITIGDLLNIVSNLKNVVYIEEVINEITDLGEALILFADELPNLRAKLEARKYNPELPIPDAKRREVLGTTIESITHSEDLSSLTVQLEKILAAF